MDESVAVKAIHVALDEGIRTIDTARAYTRDGHPGHSEALIGRALASHPAGREVLVATKGGHYRDGDEFPIDASPGRVRRDCETSLQLLGVDQLDLFQLHWPDEKVPIGTTMETFAALKDEGLIRYVGLSNVSIAQLQEASIVVPIVSVQNNFSPTNQCDRAMLDHCTEQSVAYLSYSPLGGSSRVGSLAGSFPGAARVAARLDISVQQLALAWLLELSPVMMPICGARRPETIRDSAKAMHIVLGPAELEELDF